MNPLVHNPQAHLRVSRLLSENRLCQRISSCGSEVD